MKIKTEQLPIRILHRENARVHTNRGRANQRGTAATLTIEQWLASIEAHNWLCAFCTVAPFEEMEHRIPLMWGGGTTAENCVPACNNCNKLRKAAAEWANWVDDVQMRQQVGIVSDLLPD